MASRVIPVAVTREGAVNVVRALTSQGYNVDPDAVTLLANASDPEGAVDAVVSATPDDALTVSVADVRSILDGAAAGAPAMAESATEDTSPDADEAVPENIPHSDITGSSGDTESTKSDTGEGVALETKGVETGNEGVTRNAVDVRGDITGDSTGTGEYDEFVTVFRDRYERLSRHLRGRVNHRPTNAIDSMAPGSDVALVGMVNDVRSTAGGHWLVELEDTNGVFPTLILKDRDVAPLVDELLLDEVVAIEGTLADDGGVIFVDDLHFPDIPRSFTPSTAERHVQAALVSDIHVGSQEFMAEAWERFAEWLGSEAAEHVEYLLIAGDMVEGVGVYPDQDEELTVVDIYEQYERFAEHLTAVPGDLDIIMIPGNHDAVRLAEPQPAFDDDLRDIMAVHDAQIVGNPSTVTIEGVDILLYHGVSLDEVVAELPGASYESPAEAMRYLLRKRHLAPTYGGKNRLAPEDRDYLVIEDIPDVLHSGHVHTLGIGEYHGVRTVNSGCWQAQTPFQRSVNIDPDAGYAPILDLDTLDVTVRKFH